MKEHPILFSTTMVQAILEGRKTITRRIIKPGHGRQKEWLTQELINKVPHGKIINGGWQMHHPKAGKHYMGVDVEYDSPLGWVKCPYGQPGDILWVRETWSTNNHPLKKYMYKADVEKQSSLCPLWTPSIHMPREACRLFLEVVSIRVERLQDITEEDAKAEGVEYYGEETNDYRNYLYEDKNADDWGVLTAKESFETLWESINGKGSWGANPWVWVVEFKRREDYK